MRELWVDVYFKGPMPFLVPTERQDGYGLPCLDDKRVFYRLNYYNKRELMGLNRLYLYIYCTCLLYTSDAADE